MQTVLCGKKKLAVPAKWGLIKVGQVIQEKDMIFVQDKKSIRWEHVPAEKIGTKVKASEAVIRCFTYSNEGFEQDSKLVVNI